MERPRVTPIPEAVSIERWSNFMQFIKDNLDEQSFNTWFVPARFGSFDGQTLRILVPTYFFFEYWESHFLSIVRTAVHKIFGPGVALKYKVQTASDSFTEVEATKRAAHQQPTPREGLNRTPSFRNEPTEAERKDLDPQLNPDYMFENFIEGDSNKFPRMIGLNVADKFQDTFNPLFIFGPSGVGKTHLANAIGNKMKERYPQKRVLYVSAHLLQIQYTDSVRTNRFNDFMNFYQSIDTLIIDDIQEFAGRKATQETFFNIFNHLQHNHRQLVITCDRPPALLEGMQERLLTRFNWGIVAELERPDTQLRRHFIESRISRDGLPFPQNVVNYIAQNVTGSIRELEGIINSIMAYAVVYGCDVSLDLATRTIGRIVKIDQEPVTTDKILDRVSKFYSVPLKDIYSPTRKHTIVQARQVSMYLSQKFTNLSSTQIGQLIGKRDHSTVLHACNLVEKRISTDKMFRTEVENIEREILKRQ